MTEPFEVLDPTWGSETASFAYAERLPSLAGAVIGIVSNGKHGTRPFFAALGEALQANHGVAEVEVVQKPNYSAPADAATMDKAQRWNALVSGIGD